MLPASATRLDVIFAWDRLNYLTLEEIGWLGQSVSETCAAGSDPVGTRFVSWSDVGCTFEPYDRGRRDTPSRSNGSTRQAIAAAYSEHALLGSLPDWTVNSRCQLRTSMVEYLLIRE